MNNRSIPKWEGVRGERFKYAHYYEQEPPFELLHDLESDPMELKNLVNDPKYNEKLEELRKRCRSLSSQYDNQAKSDSKRVLKKCSLVFLTQEIMEVQKTPSLKH